MSDPQMNLPNWSLVDDEPASPSRSSPPPLAAQPRDHHVRMKYELAGMFLRDPEELFELLARQAGEPKQLRRIWQSVGERLPKSERIDTDQFDVWYQPDRQGVELLLMVLPPVQAIHEAYYVLLIKPLGKAVARCFMLEAALTPYPVLAEIKANGRLYYEYQGAAQFEPMVEQVLWIHHHPNHHPLSFTQIPIAALAKTYQSTEPVEVVEQPATTRARLTQAQRQQYAERRSTDDIDVEGLAAAKRLLVWAILTIAAYMLISMLLMAMGYQRPLLLVQITGLTVLVLGVFGGVNMCSALKRPAWSYVLVVLLMFLPLANVLTLLLMNRRAQKVLHEHDYPVDTFSVS